MFMDNSNPFEIPALARFSLYCWNVILLIQPIIGRFYKMRVSWEFNIYNLLSPFINTVLSFSNTMWILSVLDSKYNVWDVVTF